MILIVGAMLDEELSVILNNLNEKQQVSFRGISLYKGKIDSNEVLVLSTGIGKVQAAFSLSYILAKYEISHIINVGIVGASNDYNIGDIVYVEKAKYHDFDVSIFGYAKGQVPGSNEYFVPKTTDDILLKIAKYKKGTLLTGDKFVTSDIKYDNYLVDMEGAALFHVANKLNQNIISLKVVSDIVNKSSLQEYKEFETETAAKIIYEVIADLLEVL